MNLAEFAWSGVTVLLLCLFGGVVGVTTRRHLHDSLIHPIVLMNGIVGYFVLLPAGYLFFTGKYIHNYESPIETLAVALLVLFATYLVSLGAFYRTDFSTALAAIPRLDRRVANPHLLFWVGCGGFVLGILLYVYYILINGGFTRLLTVTPRTAFQQVPNTGRYKLFGLAGILGGLVTVLTALYPTVSSRRSTYPEYLWSVIGLLSALTLAVAVSFRARMLILIPAAYLLVYCYTTGVLTDKRFVLLGSAVVGFGILFTFIEHTFMGSARFWMILRAAIHTARLEVFMVLVNTVPDQYSYQWGETFLRALLIGMESGPMRYGEHLDILVTGENRPGITLSAMLVGEFYLNFGVIGALLSGILYGACLKFAHQLRILDTGYLVKAIYPIALVGAVLLYPTNITFATKAIWLRLLPPLVFGIGVVFLYQHHVRPMLWEVWQ